MRFEFCKLVVGFMVCVCAATTAHGETPHVEKVAAPASVALLAMSSGGRLLVAGSGGFATTEYISQWPGSYFEARFQGAEAYFSVGKSDEILHVVVDGEALAPLVKPDAGVYKISGLSKSTHAIKVLVVTESQPAPNTFGGFGITPDAKALDPVKHSRQIEFIGDSHTVGYGNVSRKRECTTDEVWATTDDSQAFGALTANRYDADYQVNAISGRGVVRNYNGGAGDLLPAAYPYVLFDKKQAYTNAGWRPQVIVIALGTNDFSTPLHAGEKWKTHDELAADYESSYVRFVQGLRAKNPSAYIVLWAAMMPGIPVAEEESKVVAKLKAEGDGRVTLLPIAGLDFAGCHEHPSLGDDKAIAQKLEQVIDAQRDVWPAK